MGLDVETDLDWRESCAMAYVDQVGSPAFATFVAEARDDQLAGCVTAWIDHRLPGPGHDGRVAYIANMSTDSAARGNGVGTALLGAALRWIDDEGVQRVDLHATSQARGLYEKAGFAETVSTGMRRLRARQEQ